MRKSQMLNPKLQAKMILFLAECFNQGLLVKITECYRTVAEQDDIYAQGRTKAGIIVTNSPGTGYRSQHQWGNAFDVCRNDGREAFDNSDGWFNKVATIGKALGLEWGGSWTSPIDKPHYQLPDWGSTTEKLRGMYPSPEAFKKTWSTATYPEMGDLSVAATRSLLAGVVVPTDPKPVATESNFKVAVKALQASLNTEYGRKLAVDGFPGPKTLAATPTINYNLVHNTKLNTVVAVQQLLTIAGYPLEADGWFGKKTEDAIKQFQSKTLGYKHPDGELSARNKSWQKLLGL